MLRTGLMGSWLLTKSAGVVPEVDLREHTLHLPLKPTLVLKSEGDITSNLKEGISGQIK